MKPFSLEEYLKNPSRKVITRDGRNVRIICTDKQGDSYPVVALCFVAGGVESCISFLPNGKRYTWDDSPIDLFFTSEKREKWVNIYKDKNGKCFMDSLYPYASKEEAKNFNTVTNLGVFYYVDTVKIEWED